MMEGVEKVLCSMWLVRAGCQRVKGVGMGFVKEVVDEEGR